MRKGKDRKREEMHTIVGVQTPRREREAGKVRYYFSNFKVYIFLSVITVILLPEHYLALANAGMRD